MNQTSVYLFGSLVISNSCQKCLLQLVNQNQDIMDVERQMSKASRLCVSAPAYICFVAEVSQPTGQTRPSQPDS